MIEEQLRANKPKVETRQAQEIDKIQEKRSQLEEKKQFLQRKEERLNKAVEGYSFRPQVEIDHERVLKETEGREIRKKTEYDKADQVKLFNNPGFTSDKLMSDVRYKIGAALYDAGLQGSTYGQQVLSGISKGIEQPKVM
mmetsp:Transcript_6455/g.10961  ORF Transcript_6455/g.10961 Transcript_6455/m.10961 type:complete len:140 (+) Transcript_6455:319-738(+)